MITTRNRAEDLRRTLRVLRGLEPAPLEILITADGCTDDTLDVVKAEAPEARLWVNRVSNGSIVSRDRMMREGLGDLVLALDDDSYPESRDCLASIADLFAQRPQLAVLSLPQRTDEYPESLRRKDFGPVRLTRSFASCAAVLRRSTYLMLPGFESRFFHMYEEPDYALQCLGAGYEVLFAPVVSVRHHYSGRNRNEMRVHGLHARNELWSSLLRCPFPQVLGVAGYRIFSQLRYSCKRDLAWVLREPLWWWQALQGVPYCLKHRNPIPWPRYKTWLQTK